MEAENSGESNVIDNTNLFNEHNDADIILRTSDEVDIKSHRWILARTSEIFRTMFSLPQPASHDTLSEIPVIEVQETEAVIVTILKLIYPDFADPNVTIDAKEAKETWLVLEAVHKYALSRSEQVVLNQIINNSTFLSRFAIDCYAMALRFNNAELQDIAFKRL